MADANAPVKPPAKPTPGFGDFAKWLYQKASSKPIDRLTKTLTTGKVQKPKPAASPMDTLKKALTK